MNEKRDRGRTATAVGWLIDGLLAAVLPTLVLLDVRLRPTTGVAGLEALVMVFVMLPMVAALPIPVAAWCRWTGIPSPGQWVSGHSCRPRRGTLLVDLVLVAAALLLAWPTFDLSKLIPSEPIAALVTIFVPVTMTVGSLISLRANTTHEPTSAEPAHDPHAGDGRSNPSQVSRSA